MIWSDCGQSTVRIEVDQVSECDKSSYRQRTVNFVGKPGTPTVTGNLRVVESALEITYRPVVNDVESAGERAFAL